MRDIIDAIKEIVNRMVVFLRYFAAPWVAASTVWMADDDHNVFGQAGQSVGVHDTWFWIILASLGLFGVSIYSVHRAVFVPWVEEHCRQLRGGNGEPTTDERSFARWERRVAQADNPAHMAQKVLSQANATGDFLYCSCWCIGALIGLLLFFFPGRLQMPGIRWLVLVVIAVGFGVAGFIQHLHTVRLDRMAFRRYWTTGQILRI